MKNARFVLSRHSVAKSLLQVEKSLSAWMSASSFEVLLDALSLGPEVSLLLRLFFFGALRLLLVKCVRLALLIPVRRA